MPPSSLLPAPLPCPDAFALAPRPLSTPHWAEGGGIEVLPRIFEDAIRRLEPGDVALLKGSDWIGNESHGLVHRSPALAEGQPRLLLTIDPG